MTWHEIPKRNLLSFFGYIVLIWNKKSLVGNAWLNSHCTFAVLFYSVFYLEIGKCSFLAGAETFTSALHNLTYSPGGSGLSAM